MKYSVRGREYSKIGFTLKKWEKALDLEKYGTAVQSRAQ